MVRPTGVSDLYRRVGGMETRLDMLEGNSIEHAKDIQELKVTTAKICGELENTSSSLSRIEESLKVVEQITEVKEALVLMGGIVAKAIKVIKFIVLSCALLYAAYSMFKAGDVNSAVEYIREFFDLGL